MVLFFPIQYELDCINDSGDIVGRIKFDVSKNEFIFSPDNELIVLSELEKSSIAKRISDLDSGKYSIPMQDDDWSKTISYSRIGTKKAREIRAFLYVC